jgi:hypothetical protein
MHDLTVTGYPRAAKTGRYGPESSAKSVMEGAVESKEDMYDLAGTNRVSPRS